MRGWVYVISNKAMPGLLKIGFTLKDPDLRAKELDHTGAPYPYIVEYEVMVNQPRDIEQRVHLNLSHAREAKEWFRCSLQDAINAIRLLVAHGILLENVRNSQGLNSNSAFEAPPPPANGEHIKSTSLQPSNRFNGTATFASHCSHCGSYFTVTLTRHDTSVRCPECFRLNDTSSFQRREFLI